MLAFVYDQLELGDSLTTCCVCNRFPAYALINACNSARLAIQASTRRLQKFTEIEGFMPEPGSYLPSVLLFSVFMANIDRRDHRYIRRGRRKEVSGISEALHTVLYLIFRPAQRRRRKRATSKDDDNNCENDDNSHDDNNNSDDEDNTNDVEATITTTTATAATTMTTKESKTLMTTIMMTTTIRQQ